jgi:secreted trypsin-like serine protease
MTTTPSVIGTIRPLLACGATALLLSATASGIVVRHDLGPDPFLAEASRFPALFALYRTRAGHRDCIATLIAPRWAITAAHCTEDPRFLRALEGGGHPVELSDGTAVVEAVVRHGEDGEGGVDLALLRLAEPTSIAPLALYRAADEAGRTVVLPGWGGTGDGLGGLGPEDGRFRVAENRVDAARDGWLIWQFDDPRSGTGRALAREGISGPGDSGGPALVMTPEGLAVAGVGSAQRTFGRPEGLYGADEYFVRVSDFVPWIDATLAGTPAAEDPEP